MVGKLKDGILDRLVPAAYDLATRRAEEAGLGTQRRRLLQEATGATIEIGAGTGANLGHYPATVTRLVLVEPGPHLQAGLRRKIQASRNRR